MVTLLYGECGSPTPNPARPSLIIIVIFSVFLSLVQLHVGVETRSSTVTGHADFLSTHEFSSLSLSLFFFLSLFWVVPTPSPRLLPRFENVNERHDLCFHDNGWYSLNANTRGTVAHTIHRGFNSVFSCSLNPHPAVCRIHFA